MSDSPASILVTGAAGFIGLHLSLRLCNEGFNVIGIDNLNPYYDVKLKQSRVALLEKEPKFKFYQIDLNNKESLFDIFKESGFDYVVNLAAQAGVRYSIQNPEAYMKSNIHGFLNLLESCRHYPVKHLVYASSSSVYGANTKTPFSVHHNVDHPLSLYAATKKANELMAHTYSNLYNIPSTGLRFFTVYGPYGRPDMALFIFTKAIMEGKPISVFNNGKMKRDFTYIDDIIEGVFSIIDRIPQSNPGWDAKNPDSATSFAPYRLYNVGNNNPVGLLQFIEVIEKCLGKKAIKKFQPLQDGDVPVTFADIDDLMEEVNFRPQTSLETGIQKFVDWYKDYYQV